MFLLNIFPVLMVLLLLDTVFADLNQSEPRIIHGTLAKLGQLPYQVSLQYQKNDFPFCGGSLIDKKHVVTAAHCVANLNKNDQIKVWTGNLNLQNGGIHKRVKNIFIHEKYNDKTQDNDIAVLRLETPYTFNNITNSIALPSRNISDHTQCIVSGWGDTQIKLTRGSKNLLYAPVRITNWKWCSITYIIRGINLTENMICAGDEIGHDACQGDSGGPLACKSNSFENSTSLVGIVSFGIGCGIPGIPGVYTNVYPFVNWIQKQQKRNSAISLSFNGIFPLTILIVSILY